MLRLKRFRAPLVGLLAILPLRLASLQTLPALPFLAAAMGRLLGPVTPRRTPWAALQVMPAWVLSLARLSAGFLRL